jgi:hypothetical protein
MTRGEANAEARRRNAQLPDGSDARWLPRKGRDADWTVIRAWIPGGANRRPRGEAVHPPPAPPRPDPPQSRPSPSRRS